MTPRLSHILMALGACILIYGALVGYVSCRNTTGTQAEHNANTAKGEANVHQSQAKASDKAVEDLKAKLDGQEQNLDRLSKERDALLKRLADAKKPGAHPVGDGLSPTQDGVHNSHAREIERLTLNLESAEAVIAKDAEVIEAQANFIKGQKTEIGALVISRDEWKASAEARERQSMAQEVATRAWKSAVTSSRWMGRVEGFAAGFGLGLLRSK